MTLLLFIIFSLATTFASFYFILLGAWLVSFFYLLTLSCYLAFIKYIRESKVYDVTILKKLLIINVERNGSKFFMKLTSHGLD